MHERGRHIFPSRFPRMKKGKPPGPSRPSTLYSQVCFAFDLGSGFIPESNCGLPMFSPDLGALFLTCFAPPTLTTIGVFLLRFVLLTFPHDRTAPELLLVVFRPCPVRSPVLSGPAIITPPSDLTPNTAEHPRVACLCPLLFLPPKQPFPSVQHTNAGPFFQASCPLADR